MTLVLALVLVKIPYQYGCKLCALDRPCASREGAIAEERRPRRGSRLTRRTPRDCLRTTITTVTSDASDTYQTRSCEENNPKSSSKSDGLYGLTSVRPRSNLARALGEVRRAAVKLKRWYISMHENCSRLSRHACTRSGVTPRYVFTHSM